jgi:hypothetical protein
LGVQSTGISSTVDGCYGEISTSKTEDQNEQTYNHHPKFFLCKELRKN